MRSSVLARLGTFVVAAAALLLVHHSKAEACSPLKCTGGELREADATIPTNADGIVWAPKVSNRNNSEESVDASSVSLTRSDDGTQIPVQVSASTSGPDHYIVKPEDGFDPNTTYEFNGDAFCDWDGEVESHDHYTATFSTAGAAPDIESIGTFRLEDSGYGEMSTGGCLGTVGQADQRELRLRLSDAAKQWSAAFFYRVQSRPEGVDDFGPGWAKPVLFDPSYQRLPGPTSSVVSIPFRGAFLYKMCEFDGESAGDGESETWEVRMKVSHPPTSQTWTTNSVSITLECPDQGDGGDEVGVDTGPDAGKDAGQDDQDAGSDTGGDLGPDAGPPRFDDVITDEVGCGCSTGGSRVPVGGALVFVFGLIGMARWRCTWSSILEGSSNLGLFLATVVGFTSVNFFDVPDASACEPLSCTGGAIREAGQTIPSNAEGILWSPRFPMSRTHPEVTTSHVTLSAIDERSGRSTEVPVSLHRTSSGKVVVKPQGGFAKHTDYRFEAANFCEGDGDVDGPEAYQATFSTGSVGPDIDSIGTLRLAGSTVAIAPR